MNRTRIGLVAAAASIGALALLATAPANATTVPGCNGNCTPPSVPEPATLSLLALGVAGLAVARRRK